MGKNRKSIVRFSEATDVGKIIAGSSDYRQLADDLKTYVSDTSLSAETLSGSIILDSTTDLRLSFHKVSYVVSGTQDLDAGIWTYKVIFDDRYDFDHVAWSSGQRFVAIVNNYAYYAQSMGAIVPYDVQVKVQLRL